MSEPSQPDESYRGGFDALEQGQKKRDYWWTVLATDPIALPITRFLTKHRWLTPDAITALALFAGLCVGPAFALGSRGGLVAGGILFYLAFVLDCVDGKLARATGVTSARGEALDHLADGGRRASASIGLFLYFWNHEGDAATSGVVDLLPETRPGELLLVAVYVVLAYYFLEISGAEKGDGGEGIGGKWSRALAKRRLLPNPGMPDVQAAVFIVAPILGVPEWGLYVGIAMVSAAILLTVWRRLR